MLEIEPNDIRSHGAWIYEDGRQETIDEYTKKKYGVDLGSFKSFLMGFKELKTPDFLKNDSLENAKRKLNKSILPFFVLVNEDELRKLIPEENYIDTLIRIQSYKKDLIAKYGDSWKDALLKQQLNAMSENSFFPFFSRSREEQETFIDELKLLEPGLIFNFLNVSKKSTLEKMYLQEDYFPEYFMMDFFVEEFIWNGIKSGIISLFETYSQLEFVPSARSNIKRILFDNKERNFFEKCVEKINKIGLSKEAMLFLKKNLLQFGIAEDIFIDFDENTSLTTVNLKSANNQKIMPEYH